MESEGKTRTSITRNGVFLSGRDIFLILVLLALVYFFYPYLRDRGYDLKSLTNATLIVSSNNVNLRAGPGTSYPVIIKLPAGTRVIYLNEYRDINGEIWAKVRKGSSDGWVNRIYLN